MIYLIKLDKPGKFNIPFVVSFLQTFRTQEAIILGHFGWLVIDLYLALPQSLWLYQQSNEMVINGNKKSTYLDYIFKRDLGYMKEKIFWIDNIF